MKKHPRSRRTSERPTLLVLGVILASLCTFIAWVALRITHLPELTTGSVIRTIVSVMAHLGATKASQRAVPEIQPGNEGFPYIPLLAGILFVVIGVAFLLIPRLFEARRSATPISGALRRAASFATRKKVRPFYRRCRELVEDSNMLLPEWPPPAAIARLDTDVDIVVASS